MSKNLGNQLSSEVGRFLAELPEGLIIPLVSIDEAGLPHSALISKAEIRVRKELRFEIVETSSTAANLKKRGGCLLILMTVRGILYLKGTARFEKTTRSRAYFRLDLDAILQDLVPADEGPVEIVNEPLFKRLQTD